MAHYECKVKESVLVSNDPRIRRLAGKKVHIQPETGKHVQKGIFDDIIFEVLDPDQDQEKGPSSKEPLVIGLNFLEPINAQAKKVFSKFK